MAKWSDKPWPSVEDLRDVRAATRRYSEEMAEAPEDREPEIDGVKLSDMSGAELRRHDEGVATDNADAAEVLAEIAELAVNFTVGSPLRVWYWVHEYSESSEFPDVNIYRTEAEARSAMVDEVFATWDNRGGWVTREMDGEHVTQGDVKAEECDGLNLQWEGGSVDCYRLGSQVVT